MLGFELNEINIKKFPCNDGGESIITSGQVMYECYKDINFTFTLASGCGAKNWDKLTFDQSLTF